MRREPARFHFKLSSDVNIRTLGLGIYHIIIHYSDVIMRAMASQITSLTIVYSTVYSGADQRKHQRPASLAFVMGIHRWPVNSSHKGPVTRKMFSSAFGILRYDTVQSVLPDSDRCLVCDRHRRHNYIRSVGDKLSGNLNLIFITIPDSKVHGANMGPNWGRQEPGGPRVGPMNFVIWAVYKLTDGFE